MAVLSFPEECVIAFGGGVVVTRENREAIAATGSAIWMRVGSQSIARRLGSVKGRPLLADDDPVIAWERLAEKRADLYAEVASAVVDVDGMSIAAMADAVLDTCSGLGASKDARPHSGGVG